MATPTMAPQKRSSGPAQGEEEVPAFRKEVLLAYEYRCAVCGYDGQLMRARRCRHRSRPHSFGGQPKGQMRAYSLALCSLHHKLLDRGVIGMEADYPINVRITSSVAAPPRTRSFSPMPGRPLVVPQSGHPQPDPSYVLCGR